MKIVPASADDADAIAAIWNPVIRDTTITFNNVEKSPPDIEKMIAERNAAGYSFLVAREGDRVVGFASYGQFRSGVGYAHAMEHSVFLTPDALGKGIGQALLAALEVHARAHDVHSMTAGVSDDNVHAIRFHKRLGYSEVARMPEVGLKFGRWLGLVLLQKIL